MATPSDRESGEYHGGYQDRFWYPRVWDGMNISGSLRLLARNHFRINPIRVCMAMIAAGMGLGFNSPMGWLQSLLLGGKIRQTEIEHQPIFIIGHWRAGTTLLHELLILDSRHAFPSTYACGMPNHYLLSKSFMPAMTKFLMPTSRPQDAMLFGWNRPQEDEFALCNLGVPSPYLTWAFPNHPPQYPEYLDMDGVSDEDLAHWKESLLWFIKCLTLENPKRIVLKSPPHLGRVKVLQDLFPRARFVHIYRDPYATFPSTVNLWKRLWRNEGFQRPTYEKLHEYIFETFNRMYAAFERDRELIAPERFCEVSYEQLVADPVGQIRRIYEELHLGEFDQVRPNLEEAVADQADYKPNRHQISPDLRAEIARRWAPFIEKYGYDASPVGSDEPAA